MRKTILIFIAATIAATVSTPAAASFWDRCSLKRLQCRDHCHRHSRGRGRGRHHHHHHHASYGNKYCLASCDATYNKCKIRESVMIPGRDILGNAPAFGSQGPSATGAPMAPAAAPSAPPVIIR